MVKLFHKYDKKIKIFISLFLSYFFSFYANEKIFMANSPDVNPDTVKYVEEFPNNIKNIGMQINEKLVSIISPINNISQPEINQPGISFPTIWISPVDIFPTVSEAIPTIIPTIKVQPTTNYFPSVIPSQIQIPTKMILPSPTFKIIPTATQIPTKIPTKVPTPTVKPNITLADFGKCLAAKNMILHTIPGCSECQRQKTILGEALKYITEINCQVKPQECSKYSTNTVPFWGQNGKLVIPGRADIETISAISGCAAP
jgi:hypothetical protein